MAPVEAQARLTVNAEALAQAAPDGAEAYRANGGVPALAEGPGDVERLASLPDGTGARVGAGIEHGPGYDPAFLDQMGDVLPEGLS